MIRSNFSVIGSVRKLCKVKIVIFKEMFKIYILKDLTSNILSLHKNPLSDKTKLWVLKQNVLFGKTISIKTTETTFCGPSSDPTPTPQSTFDKNFWLIYLSAKTLFRKCLFREKFLSTSRSFSYF